METFINSALCQATTTPPPNPPKKDKFKDKLNSATCMQKLMYLVIGNRHFLGANWLSINWNMVEKKCETTFKLDILLAYHALQENYLFSPTSSSSFSALSFFTRNTLAISSVFVVLYLYFNFFVSCESLDSENKRANNNYY